MATEWIITALALTALVQSITFVWALVIIRQQAQQLFDTRINEMLATTRLLNEAEERRADRDEFVTYIRTLDQMVTRLQGVAEVGSRLFGCSEETVTGAADMSVEDLATK
mgnify:CR=1 FL=1